MKTLLIFAGQSTRFWPLREKAFTVVAGKTILERQVGRLRAAGLKDIVLVGGKHNIAHAKKLFPALKAVVQKDPSLGMREAFVSALPLCKNEPVLLLNSNDVLDVDAYKLLLDRFRASKADGVLLARKVRDYFPGGYLTVKGKKIVGIVEKPGKGNEPSTLVNIVAHIHRDPKLLLALLKSIRTDKDDGYEQALDKLFKDKTFEAVPYAGNWQAIKYPWHLLQLLPLFLSELTRSIDKMAQVHPSAVLDGPVVLSKGVKVMAHATIVGPCFVGENTIVANNALVRGSSIGKNCVIGYNTEVVRSVLADDVWTHSSYVGDSVIGSNVSFGAGTTIGNLRLDESEISSAVKGEPVATGLTKFGTVIGDDCRTGIHSCVSPGVKIGGGSFIGSNVLITQDIPDDSFVKAKNADIDIRPNTKRATDPHGREKFRSKLK